ncbi:hypothetical protein [Chthonobacter albigriseus]|uniref:hypothetical protein n=1 Tax=Chthonobacter albigriseus TaxID=1683161 RepID=UPI0015EFDB32|nr:hypothetical protein [Chthonobacter albigriseus]
MAITTVALGPSVGLLVKMRTQLDDLQRQLGTGQKSETYGGLGTKRTVSVSFRAQITDLESYTSSVEQMALRVKLMDTAMTRLGNIPSDMRAAIDPNVYTLRQDGRTDAQKAATVALDEVIGLLNAEADGRYLFAGAATETQPVVDIQTMLQGAGGRDGLSQVTADRLVADMGTAGTGRVETAVAGSTVTVARQTPLSAVFGFKIADAESTLSNVTVTPTNDPDPDPATNQGILDFSVDFTGQPTTGQTFSMELKNPDGTLSKITLTATAASTPGKGEFSIGATPADTAANFHTLLSSEIQRVANTDLKAASAVQASEEFFDTFGGQAPRRADDTSGGGTLATATTLRDGTETDTVFWYRGTNDAVDPADPSTLPRNDVSSRVDKTVDVAYGARANEDGLRQVVQSLAAMANATFSNDVADDKDRYRALAERTRTELTFPDGAEKPQDIHAEIAMAGKVANDAKERHQANRSAMLQMVDDVEGVKYEDVAAQILTLKTRMQASYQTTSLLSELSLVNYIR